MQQRAYQNQDYARQISHEEQSTSPSYSPSPYQRRSNNMITNRNPAYQAGPSSNQYSDAAGVTQFDYDDGYGDDTYHLPGSSQQYSNNFYQQHDDPFDENTGAYTQQDAQFQPPPQYSNHQYKQDFERIPYQQQQQQQLAGGTDPMLMENTEIIDYKIMENIQKYLSHYMSGNAPQSLAPNIQQPSNFLAQTNQQMQQQQFITQDPLLSGTAPINLNNTIVSTSYDYNPLLNSTLQSTHNTSRNVIQNDPLPVSQQFQRMNIQTAKPLNQTQTSITTQDPFLNKSQIQNPIVNQAAFSVAQQTQNQQLKSDEFLQLKQTIENLTKKMDTMQSYTDKLQGTIEQKDREIQKIRGINTLRVQQQSSMSKVEASQSQKRAAKREKGTQTVINQIDNHREYETFSYLYEKDQDLLRSEKDALLKYMRKEVVQNQEFLERIRDLEQVNDDLKNELHMALSQLARANALIQANYQDRLQEDSLKPQMVDQAETCNLLNDQHVDDVKQELEQMRQQYEDSQETIRQLQESIEAKAQELTMVNDSTNHQLYQECAKLKDVIQDKVRVIESLRSEIQTLNQEKDQQASEIDDLDTQIENNQKSHEDVIKKLKIMHESQLDKARDEKEKVQQLVKERDSLLWDLKAKIEEQQKVIQELEEVQNKKKKSKKQVDCVNCLKKDMELQSLSQKIEKQKIDMNDIQTEFEKVVKGKEVEMRQSQSMVESLTKQLQQNVVNMVKNSQNGQVDPAIQEALIKLEKENEEKSSLIENLKVQMQKQAQQFMQAMMQQEQTKVLGAVGSGSGSQSNINGGRR